MQAELFAPLDSVTSPATQAESANAGAAASLQVQVDALPTAWRDLLAPCVGNAAWKALATFVDGERAAGRPVFPRSVFHALHLTPPDAVRVVILGQDPYHGTGTVGGVEVPQAHGLAFSVPDGVKVPPSLRNIFKEIGAEYGTAPTRASGNLEGWARQGVLLLNTVLTVEQGQAASHAKRGWEAVTDCLIHALATTRPNLVFLLWGSHAQAKRSLLEDRAGREQQSHCVLEAPHPSPLSAHRGFLGCGHFRQANEWLARHGRSGIDWLAT